MASSRASSPESTSSEQFRPMPRKRKADAALLVEEELVWFPFSYSWKDNWTVWQSREKQYKKKSESFRAWMEIVRIQKEQKQAEFRGKIAVYREAYKRIAKTTTQPKELEKAARRIMQRMLQDPVEVLEDLKEDLDALKYFFKYGNFNGF